MSPWYSFQGAQAPPVQLAGLVSVASVGEAGVYPVEAAAAGDESSTSAMGVATPASNATAIPPLTRRCQWE